MSADFQRDMCIQQGYVPSGCTLPGQMVYALTCSQGDACKGCNEDRSICKGRRAPADSYGEDGQQPTTEQRAKKPEVYSLRQFI